MDQAESDAQLKVVFRNFPIIEENIKFLDSKVEVCKNYWKTFHMQFMSVMNLLKPAASTSRKNPICEELIDVIIKGRMTPVTIKFFTEELYGFKTLQRLDENSQLVLSNIIDEVNDKIVPIVERTLILLSEVRGLVRAKQVQFGGPNQTAQMYFGLNESIIQKLIDFISYYYHQV